MSESDKVPPPIHRGVTKDLNMASEALRVAVMQPAPQKALPGSPSVPPAVFRAGGPMYVACTAGRAA